MARINLLPWRAERRKQRQKEFGVMLGFAVLAAIALSLLIIFYYNGQISGQNERNAYLQGNIDEVQKEIDEIAELDTKKNKLLDRKKIIEELQADRSQMVHLFDSLVRTIPDGAVLTSIKQVQDTLTLNGRAQSNARVSTYLRNLESSGWMSNPELSIIEAAGEDKALPYQFTLQVKLANPNAPRDSDGDGIPDELPAAGYLPGGSPLNPAGPPDAQVEPAAAPVPQPAPTAPAEPSAEATATGATS
ncbi:MAG: PilN domain-containing protein [Pseudomonadota bacterium]|nr:PilN domain-containing protein [Pseudomonadota bacterium]